MPQVDTLHFGAVDYDEHSVIHFPEGIPAFDTETHFVMIQQESTAPVLFLQSLQRADLVFMTVPAGLVDPSYRGSPGPEDIETLELPAGGEPEEGKQVLTLAIVTVGEDRIATANLMSPVIVNLATRRALQSVQPWSGYSARHPLQGGKPAAEEPPCS
jgi:flagellar assembly factor FliW